MTTQPTALDTYLQRLPMILDKIEALRQLADEHFDHHPDTILWGHVGDLGRVDQALDELLASYFTSDWMPAATARTAMPLALDMAHLYSVLLQGLMPLPARPQEALSDWIARIEQAASKRREVEKTQARLAKEKQFNRKVEINATLRQLKSELEQLSR